MVAEIEFGTRADAMAAREEFEEQLADIDDAREKGVALVEDAEQQVRELQSRAAESRDWAEGGFNPAEMELAPHEAEALDFSETSYVEALAGKAAAAEAGVSDFQAYYDPDLTVGENRERFEAMKTHPEVALAGGERLDAEPTQQEMMAEGYRTAQRGRQEHAIKGVQQGSEEARQALREMGWSPAEIREIEATGQVEAALTPGATVHLSTGHEITARDWATAKRSHEHRRVGAQNADEGRKAPITTDVEKWRRHPNRFDYPGVDTRRPMAEFLTDEDREEFRELGHRLWTWQPGTGRGL